MSLTRLTHELVSLFAVATARKLDFLTTEYLFEAGIDTSVFAWHSTQSDAVSDSNDVDIQPILSNSCRSRCWHRNHENDKLDLCRNLHFIRGPFRIILVLPKFPLGEDRSTSSKISGVPSKTCGWMGYNRKVKRTLPVR